MTMCAVAIRADGLSKRYRIGQTVRYKALRDTLADAISAPFRWIPTMFGSPSSKPRGQSTIWAIKDVSFEIGRGEVVGLIGGNGAGKSTLLKILSRITEPTEGHAEIHGRVGSLLEVGTGFHPELTGRDNIYLNGAILGMKRREIDRKFDEIVAFAEIERFLDTSVKYYSSGMYVRLAFAVAAHLEPEILLVDEVLAVGDAAFQQKCLGKMSEVAHEGRTVLFVSHNLAAIKSLCQTACLMTAGRLVKYGPAGEIAREYLQSVASRAPVPLDQRGDRSGNGAIRAVSLQIESADGDGVIRPTSRLKVNLGYRGAAPFANARFLIGVYDYSNTGIFLLDTDAVGGLPEVLPAAGTVTCLTDCINLTPGRCYVNVALFRAGIMVDHVEFAGDFDVESDNAQGFTRLPERDWVLCILPHVWSVHEEC